MDEKLVILVPCFNEQKNVRATINSIIKILPNMDLSAKIEIIDDGSTDETRIEIEKICKDYDSCGMHINQKNVGLGRTVLDSYKRIADGSWVSVIPGDNEFVSESIFNHSIKNIRQLISAYSFSDEQTKHAILELYLKFQYVPDPHGAVAYLGLKEYLKNHNQYGIFLETAHSVKFLEIIKPLVSKEIPIPTQIEEVINKKKESICIANYNDLKEYLIKS